MPIALSGLGSFDSTGVVTQLVAIAHQPIDALNTTKTNVTSASSTLNLFSSRLGTLKSTATALSDSSGYSSYVATSSDPALVASAGGAAQAGSYDITVTSLASAQKMRSDTQGTSITALGLSGTLSISVGTKDPVAITVGPGDTLADIATKLTKSGARISASVLYDGTSYRLAVQGLDTGAANAFTISQSGLDLGLETAANKYQAATDASLTIDGVAVTRPTNQVTGVIPGVTLALTKQGVTSTVRVASDTTSLKNKIANFVAAYNDIVNAGHTATGYGSTPATNPVLAGDSTIRRALTTFSKMVGSAIPGTTGAYTTLASVGIKLTTTGTLDFDSTKLDTAVTADPDAVRRLFITDTTLGATGVMKGIATAADSFVTGTSAGITARITALSAKSKAIDDSIAAKQVHVDAYEAQLKKQYSDLDQIMSKYTAETTAIGSITSVTG